MSALSASRSAALVAALFRLGVDAAVWTDGATVPPDHFGPYVWTSPDGTASVVDRVPNSKGDQTHATLVRLPNVATCLVGRVRSGKWDRLIITWDAPTESNSTEGGKMTNPNAPFAESGLPAHDPNVGLTWRRGALPEHEVSARKSPEQCYPKVGTHTWQEFAGFAVEMGGYGDLTMIDPYSGRRFWCPVPDQVWEQSTMAAYRYLLEQAEKHGFPENTPTQVATG